MNAELLAVERSYLDHLSDADLGVLAGDVGSRQPTPPRQFFGQQPGRLDERLSSRGVFDRVFGDDADAEPFLAVSPFLTFALCVSRAAEELDTLSYVPEWLGPGRRAPVFDVERLREFMAAPRRRLFLAELLASYTHVASGSVVRFTRRGIRRQRFSELDPVRMSGLLEVVSEEERPGILRRLGDLALFLTGVFPDHLARNEFGPLDESRLLRAAGLGSTPPLVNGPAALAPAGAVGLLEQLGRRWYEGASKLLPRPLPANLVILTELPQRFDQARRILGLITERFLFSRRDRWFGFSGT